MLKSTLNHWQDWGFDSKPYLMQTFTQGQSHHTGLIDVDGKYFVLKVFNHSFEQALVAERWANTQGLSPNIIYAADGVQILEYIEAEVYTPSKLPKLANNLHKLHTAGAPNKKRFNLIQFANEYLINADDITNTWHQQLLPTLIEFINDPTPWVFCHNDLVKENCLFDQRGTVFFIDWEFAQKHNPWFDLAAIMLYFDLNKAQSRSFLEAYETTWSNKVSERIFYSSQVSLLWTDLLWNMHKYGSDYRYKKSYRFMKLASLAQQLNIDLTSNS